MMMDQLTKEYLLNNQCLKQTSQIKIELLPKQAEKL